MQQGVELKTHEGHSFCVKGMLKQEPGVIHIVCRCYYIIATSKTEKTAYKTFGSAFVGTVTAVYERLKLKKGPQFKLVHAYNSIWSIIELPERELCNVQSMVDRMQLRLVPGLPGVFGLELSQHTFPLQNNDRVWSIEGEFRMLEEMKDNKKDV